MRGSSMSLEQHIRNLESAIAEQPIILPPRPSLRYQVVEAIEQATVTINFQYLLAQLQHQNGQKSSNLTIKLATTQAEHLARYWKKWNVLPGPSAFPETKLLPNGKPIPDLPRRIDGVCFRFGAAALISLLVKSEISATFYDVLPNTGSFGDIFDDLHFLNFPDAGLVEILKTGRRPRRWKEILDFATKRFRNTQILDNFEGYANLILKCQKQKWDEAMRAVEECERLYSLRPYHTGDHTIFDLWEVSIPKSPKRMDLRLAALMKVGFRDSPNRLKEIQSHHKW